MSLETLTFKRLMDKDGNQLNSHLWSVQQWQTHQQILHLHKVLWRCLKRLKVKKWNVHNKNVRHKCLIQELMRKEEGRHVINNTTSQTMDEMTFWLKTNTSKIKTKMWTQTAPWNIGWRVTCERQNRKHNAKVCPWLHPTFCEQKWPGEIYRPIVGLRTCRQYFQTQTTRTRTQIFHFELLYSVKREWAWPGRQGSFPREKEESELSTTKCCT